MTITNELNTEFTGTFGEYVSQRVKDDKLIELHNLKLSDSHIAKVLNVSPTTIHKHKRNLGLPFNYKVRPSNLKKVDTNNLNISEQIALKHICKKESCNEQDIIRGDNGEPDFIVSSGQRYEVKNINHFRFSSLQIQNLRNDDIILITKGNFVIAELQWNNTWNKIPRQHDSQTIHLKKKKKTQIAIIKIQDDSMTIKCPKCSYEWDTKSKLIYVCCPSCRSSVKIRDIKNNKVTT